MNEASTISAYQPILQSIALKMVGSIADAEDLVQDTFLKWLTTDRKKIQNTKSYLVRAITNNCINHLNALKRKKNELVDTINQSYLIEKARETELAKFDIENEVAQALSVVHKKLEPLEKSVYILREIFDFEYEHLQEIFDKKKDNLRQMLSRSKEKLNKENFKFKSIEVKSPQFLESFKTACSRGQIEQFIQHLKKDLTQKINK